MRTSKFLLPTAFATGLFLAGGWSLAVAAEGGYSFEEADTDKSGTLSQEEYEKATGEMSAELEQFKAKDASRIIDETAPVGSGMEKEPGADPTGFKSEDASRDVVETAPIGSEEPAPEPGADPTPFKDKSESIRSTESIKGEM